MRLLHLTNLWIHSWNVDFIIPFSNLLLKWIMQNSTNSWSKQCDRFLNLHKSPSVVIYISLFLSSLLSLPTTKTPTWHLGILRSLKHAIGKRNVWNTWIRICLLTVGSRNLSNSLPRQDQVSVWICIFISRTDYWNEEWDQYSMNQFISPWMK